MSSDIKFEGWLARDTNAAKGQMVWDTYEPKTWTESDVDIKISHCGVCGTDVHTLGGLWGATMYPVCVGHEIVGKVVRAGKDTSFKVGDRVGVGAQSDSCHKSSCHECSRNLEHYCKNVTGTYNGKYADGSSSYGGFANYSRVPARSVFRVPSKLASSHVAPMLCAGITMYSPLKRSGAGPGKNVGIVGLGGLGHFGVLFAKAMGSRVVVISRTSKKKADAIKMGADDFIATAEDGDWAGKHANTLDLVISTAGILSDVPKLLQMLRTRGELVQVGAPDGAQVEISPMVLIMGGTRIGGSITGSHDEVEDMLQFAADKDLKPWIEERPLAEANQAILDLEKSDVRYRYVLVNETA